MDLGVWNSVFVVPSCVVDEYIKLAGPSQIKVLLWILRNSGKEFTFKDISDALSIHESEVADAVRYWSQVGVLSKKQEKLVVSKEETETSICDENKVVENNKPKENIVNNKESAEIKKSKPRSISRSYKPNSSYIAQRVSTSEDIAFLMQEAQVILGRPISNGDSSILLMLHDNDGLPVDVIIMLLQYAVSIDKNNMKYIEKMGISWGCNGIDTLEKAERYITELDKSSKAWRRFMSIMGIDSRTATTKEQEAVNRWINMWGYSDDMIKEAYERCIDSNGKYILKYIDSIIKRWKNEGIYNIEQAKSDSQRRSTSNKTGKLSSVPSYDIDEYEKYSIFDEIG